MNFEQIGKPIAKIVNPKRKVDRQIFVDGNIAKEPGVNYYNNFSVREDEEIQQIPHTQQERFCLYISGMSGSGKSFYARKYAIEYHKLFPKNDVYLFSSVTNDKSIEQKWIKQVKLNDEFIATDFNAEDFANSLVIFDDIDTIMNKPLKKKLQGLLAIMLETGRHHNTSIIYTSHAPCKGGETKCILNECHSITIFPQACGARTLKYLLENYFGFDKHQVNKLKSLPSRWCTVTKGFPCVIMYEKGCYLLN